MKNIISKISAILDKIYGWGIFICLFVGGLTFFGYIVAFIIGGETATAICNFIYKGVFTYLIYGGNIIVLLGLLSMYLKNQKSLTVSDNSKK